MFALDCVRAAQVLESGAKSVAEGELKEQLEKGYGIFSGRPTARARIRFSPTRARWVSNEEWHPQQVGRFEPDGSWTLEFPYGDDRELLMDILRHVPEVEVLAPSKLRRRVREALQAGLEKLA
jgi:predicted DNA-binding transcriptional regulator YafY